MIETINFSFIQTLDELRMLSETIQKGLIAMPNISQLANHLKVDRKTVRKALNEFTPSKTRTRINI